MAGIAARIRRLAAPDRPAGTPDSAAAPDSSAAPSATPDSSAAPSARPDPSAAPEITPDPSDVPEPSAAGEATPELQSTPDSSAAPEATPERRAKSEPKARPKRKVAWGPRLASLRWLVPPVVAIVLLAFVALFAWSQEREARARQDASRESVAAAEAAARAIFSYDHKGFDAAVNNGRAFTTGDFTKEYEQTTSALKPAVLSEQAVVRAEVSAAGVVTVTADRAEILLYVNQYRKNVNIQGEKMDQNRIVLTMVLTPEGWKVLQASAI